MEGSAVKHVGIIGMGNMGYAIARSLKRAFPAEKLSVTDKDTNRAEECARELEGTAYTDYAAFFKNVETCIVAVKPQHLESLFSDIASYTRELKIITIAAGKKISYFSEHLSTSQVVRFMPNIAARMSRSLTAVSFGEHVTGTFKKESLSIAEAFGETVIVPESMMPAVTGLSGSGIAYVFAFVHALALGGTHSGIPYDTALTIAVQTIEGALALLQEEGGNPVTPLTKVISAGGTTIEGIKALESGGFTASVMDAVKKAADRALDFEK